MNSLSFLHALCISHPNLWQSGLVLNLFLGGLIGSVTHCAGMCSPFVLLLSKSKPQISGVLLPYHLGRITTYVAIGIIGAALSAHIASFANFKMISAIMLAMAGILFLLTAFSGWLPRACGLPSWVTKNFGALIYKDYPGKIFLAGLLLGFIPCGLVYAALLASAATADPLLALAGMAAFGFGTMPALVTVGVGCRKIKPEFAAPSSAAFKFLSVFNAFLLFVMAGEMII